MKSCITVPLWLLGVQSTELFPRIGPFTLLHEQSTECVYFGKEVFVQAEHVPGTVLLQAVRCPNHGYWRWSEGDSVISVVGQSCGSIDLTMLEEQVSQICYSASVEEMALLNSVFEFGDDKRLIGPDGSTGDSVLGVLGFAVSHAMQGIRVEALRGPATRQSRREDVWMIEGPQFNASTVTCAHGREVRMKYRGNGEQGVFVVSEVHMNNVRLQVIPSAVTVEYAPKNTLCRRLSREFSSVTISEGLTDALVEVTDAEHCEIKSLVTGDRVMVSRESEAVVMCGSRFRFVTVTEGWNTCEELRKRVSLFRLCSEGLKDVNLKRGHGPSLGHVLTQTIGST